MNNEDNEYDFCIDMTKEILIYDKMIYLMV